VSETVRKTTIARLHHNAWITRDQEATRRFYEDLIGLPLVATWSETDELFGAERVYCHTFFGLADGSALAFFQFANEEDQALFGPTMPETPFSHIALKVDRDTQHEVSKRLADAGYTGDGTPPTLPDEVWKETTRRYASAYERLTGTTFEPGSYPIGDRLVNTLTAAGIL